MARTLLVAPGQRGALSSIAEALEVADDDTVVTIAPGTYTEPVQVHRRKVTLVARDRGTVTLEGQAGEPTVSCVGGVLELSGMTVIGCGRTSTTNGSSGPMLPCAG
ncbi:hypothetical protein [Thermocrispum sp.]|uniref:hypothetical protein n=1 Tax=Thermocrispum sp. TaxID=2060768 RepID=UPI00257CF037|nr:hypothetical protein [Thermocrispum sp.]